MTNVESKYKNIKMDRRDFLFKSAVAGTTILANTKNLESYIPKGKKPKSVLIIGAGFAGLAAALKLKNLGVKVTLIEARDRIGGRVFSFKPEMGEGQVIELGAEWVGNSHERVIKLCNEFGLSLENNQFETDLNLSGLHSTAGNWGFSSKMEEFSRKSIIFNF